MIARRLVLLPVLLWLLVPVLATGAHADNGIADLIEVSGRLSPETRLYSETAAHPGQRTHASGFAAEATVYMEDNEGRSITITPFCRYDAGVFSDIALEGSATSEMTGWAERRPGVARL